MKLLTFLGTGDYKDTTYQLGDKNYTSPYIQEALASIMNSKPKLVVVFVTEQARKIHWSKLEKRFELQNIDTLAVDIPSGKNEAELWELFDLTVQALDQGEWALDITHAFRFIPIFAYGASIYAKAMQNIELSSIFYGAFEARDELGVTPVFDLSPLLDLNEWVHGAQSLMKTGNSEILADLLIHSQRKAYKNKAGNKENLPTLLTSLGNALSDVNDAFQCAQPSSYFQSIEEFSKRLPNAEKQLDTWAKPFVRILQRIENQYRINSSNVLTAELQLIRTYTEKGMIIQGVQLLNEWLINYAVDSLGLGDHEAYKNHPTTRQSLIEFLSAHSQNKEVEAPKEITSQSLNSWQKTVPDFFKMILELPKLRNDLAHCGYRKGATPPKKFKKQLKAMAERAERLPL
tara:strand:+ start:157 stop:1365 length:1209 start_codon:yes stop_codon:yes gene_type:complete